MNVETAGAAALAAHLDVDKVGFTGLTEGGSSSLARCRWSLEGKCPTSCAKTPMWKPASQDGKRIFLTTANVVAPVPDCSSKRAIRPMC